MQTSIFCKTKFEGTHCFPGAPNEVAYLREEHRHMFGVEVEMDVYHNDREVEFIMLKHFVDKCIHTNLTKGAQVAKLGTMSCEQIATILLAELENRYGTTRAITITVDEDGENGAVVYED